MKNILAIFTGNLRLLYFNGLLTVRAVRSSTQFSDISSRCGAGADITGIPLPDCPSTHSIIIGMQHGISKFPFGCCRVTLVALVWQYSVTENESKFRNPVTPGMNFVAFTVA